MSFHGIYISSWLSVLLPYCKWTCSIWNNWIYFFLAHLDSQCELRTIRNMNCLWWPYLLTEWNEMSNLNREPSIDVSYQVSVHLAKRFQRRKLKYEKLMDNWCQVMAKAHIDCQGELKRNKFNCFILNMMATIGNSCFWLFDS
jgi:hypothetical protein